MGNGIRDVNCFVLIYLYMRGKSSLEGSFVEVIVVNSHNLANFTEAYFLTYGCDCANCLGSEVIVCMRALK